MNECKEFINKGFEFEFMDAKSQEAIMKSKPFMYDLIPWKRVQRRNLGYYFAYKENYNYLITIDDDNYPLTKDLIIKHIENLESKENEIISPKNEQISWYNPCSLLPNRIVHRGFPHHLVYKKQEFILKKGLGRVVASEGFWLGDPDITALSRVEGNPLNTKIEKIELKNNFCLSFLLKSPHNTQNTAYRREIIPALFLSAKIGRYDDIWASYFLKALMYIKEDLISYGYPLVRQDRNDHDILHDLELELYGMKNTVEFVDELFCVVNRQKEELKDLNYFDLTKKVSEMMLTKSVKFSWYYLDILRWIELLMKE